MTRFWWVRHGPTGLSTVNGWNDVPAVLDDPAPLEWLRGQLPKASAFSSDLGRAVETARAVGFKSEQRQGLRETNFGAWEGLSFAQIDSDWRELSREVWGNPGVAAPPGGESWNAMAGRVVTEIEALKGQEGDIVIFAHHGPILAAVAHALGLTPGQAMAIRISHLSVTRLDWLPDSGVWSVDRINQTL